MKSLIFPFLLSLELHYVVRDGFIGCESVSRPHAGPLCEKHVEHQWREHASLPETLPYVELVRVLSIIQLHACLYGVVELGDDGELSRGYAKTSKDMPQKGSVDGVLRFREVNKPQVQWGVLLPCQFLQLSCNEHHVTRRALGSEPTLFFRQCVLAFAIVIQATRHDFEEYFAGVSHEQEATISATLSPIPVLEKRLNCCIFLMLRCATSHTPSDDDIVEPSEGVLFFFLSANISKRSAGNPSGPTAFRFANARIGSSTSYLDGASSSGLQGSHCLISSTMLGSRVSDLTLSSLRNHLTHRSRVRALHCSSRPSSSLMYCESNVLFPSTSIPLRCLYKPN